MSHARLPVTHTRPTLTAATEPGGTWYYYARGCSDLHLDVGRTLSARNRIHASILLTKRLEGGNEASSLLLAAQSLRNHKKLKGNCKFWEKDVLERARSRRGVRQYAHLAAQPDAQLNLSTLEGLLSAAARGFFVWPGAGCNTMRLGAHPDSCRGGCMRRASALSYIFTYNECVDELNARLMRRMVGTSVELDTLTLTHQRALRSGSGAVEHRDCGHAPGTAQARCKSIYDASSLHTSERLGV
jgi:hypothetical protein